VFQVLVNAKAKNAMTTRRPRRAAREISRPSCERSVRSGAGCPTESVALRVAILVRPVGAAIVARVARVRADLRKRRIDVDRADFLAYRVTCPFDGTPVGPRFVTREHLDVPPDPPYAATVRCPADKELFEVVFREAKVR